MDESLQRPTRARATTPLYRLAFIRNCHRWLRIGYSLLDARSFATAAEPAITGELVRAMKEAKLMADAPGWMIRMYVADDPPVNSPGRLGKHRRRVDMEFERSERRATFHFHCEAKRLYRSDSVAEYFGSEGLGMFLAGEYARNEVAGGMLGYVQTENTDEWIDRLKAALALEQVRYGVTNNGQMQAAGLIPELPQIQTSEHDRPSIGSSVRIYHTLFAFLN